MKNCKKKGVKIQRRKTERRKEREEEYQEDRGRKEWETSQNLLRVGKWHQ